jgi:carotenoid cleavage dioxygenase-like enzyme
MTDLSTRTRAWNAAMTATPGELDLVISPAAVQGVIPEALRGGRHLQNGPGWTQIGDRLAHPFDGHGLVRALSFSADGGARLHSRFVRTPAYQAERAAGKVVYRGLGTNRSEWPWQNWWARRCATSRTPRSCRGCTSSTISS